MPDFLAKKKNLMGRCKFLGFVFILFFFYSFSLPDGLTSRIYEKENGKYSFVVAVYV